MAVLTILSILAIATKGIMTFKEIHKLNQLRDIIIKDLKERGDYI